MKIRTILMSGCLLGLAAVAGKEAKPETTPAANAVPSEAPYPDLRLRLETWEMPALEAAKRLDSVGKAEDLAKLRTECLGGLPDVSLMLSSAINVGMPEKVLAESVTERIFPTEYQPPELICGPQTFSQLAEKKPTTFGGWLENLAGHATPTSFETRNTGTTLEAEISRATGQEKIWNASIAVEDVRFLGRETFGADELGIGMPAFSCFRSTAHLRLKEGQWQILSVMEPPRGLDSKPSDKRWITLVRLDLQE
ncbi:hypothetical protein OKA05_22745 [Luteolibacter arcticus]|uniref:Uncharacterized protein n=1 Tax=Luteolibacter arcticus TaxID=1581411 RepID=A0ABT3GPG4_9BACT|nr:hypothetical protein [Luteolibacter arcticus]MCW1925397.1 hypothetical protein [Luteolibacter arcticus]